MEGFVEIFLVSLVGKVLDWAIGEVLDVKTKCWKCGQIDATKIGNLQSNTIECTNCHMINTQFTNACNFTVNRLTLKVGHISINDWSDPGYRFCAHPEVMFQIKIDGLNGRRFVMESVIRLFSDEKIITSKRSLITPEDLSRAFTQKFPDYPSQPVDVLICDSRILSEYKDLLCENRRIFEPR